MTFDKLAKAVEQCVPDLRDLVARSKLFIFPGNAADLLPHTCAPEEAEFLNASFFLPFQHIAIDDGATCTLLWQDEPNLIGSQHPVNFLDCLPSDTPASAFCHEEQASIEQMQRQLRAERGPRAMSELDLTCGRFERLQFGADGRIGMLAHILWTMIIDGRDNRYTDSTGKAIVRPDETQLRALVQNGKTAVEEVLYFNSPERFIVEASPAKSAKPGHHPLIARSHQRPNYTLLHPHEIRQKLGLAMPTGRHVTSHARRAHFRTYRAEKWTNMKGKVIRVQATWVGPDEKVLGNKKYKVLFDR